MFDLIDFLETMGLTEDGWDCDGNDLLVCPCGVLIELDGVCPDGHRSPIPI